jgi:high-affinity iron transporter
MVSADFPQQEQELFAAIIGLIAVFLLASMVFWMRKAARSIKGELQHSIDEALGEHDGKALALVFMVFLAVAREGLESVFFLLATFQQASGLDAPIGALAGVLVAAAIGYAIYVGTVRLNLRRFFRWTGVLILVVAAGLLAGSLRALHEAGWWNSLQETAFDLSHVLPTDGFLGSILSGIFGYVDTPTIGEVAVYVIFLLITLPLFLLAPRTPSQAASRA